MNATYLYLPSKQKHYQVLLCGTQGINRSKYVKNNYIIFLTYLRSRTKPAWHNMPFHSSKEKFKIIYWNSFPTVLSLSCFQDFPTKWYDLELWSWKTIGFVLSSSWSSVPSCMIWTEAYTVQSQSCLQGSDRQMDDSVMKHVAHRANCILQKSILSKLKNHWRFYVITLYIYCMIVREIWRFVHPWQIIFRPRGIWTNLHISRTIMQ
jgi:hypothetical protein